jgi:hypothetical protein
MRVTSLLFRGGDKHHSMIRYFLIAAALCTAIAAPTQGQMRISVGAGLGVAGSTESSLSEGKGGTILMGQVVRSVLPFAGIGAEVNRWHTGSLNTTFVTGIVQIAVPLTGLRLKVGAGYGTGDPDGLGKVSGTTLHLGGSYDFTIPAAPIAVTVFGNALLSHAASRSMQMVGGGLALTVR